MFLFLIAGMFPAHTPLCGKEDFQMTNILRAYYKPAGSNTEIKGPFYELSSHVLVRGEFNCEVLTLGYSKGKSTSDMLFRPIDPKKPIVLAVDSMTHIAFVSLDYHLKEEAEEGMRNCKPFQTSDFIVDCKRSEFGSKSYWSITSEGMTFVYGDVTFPDTWTFRDCDLLCAFVGGEMTANQLRMHAYLTNREAVKEERREAHVQRLMHELNEVAADASATRDDLSRATNRYEQLVIKLKTATNGILPFIDKANLLKIIKEND